MSVESSAQPSQFQLQLLVVQNTQMLALLQRHRHLHSDMSAQNELLNQWVKNLAEVVSGLGRLWKNVVTTVDNVTGSLFMPPKKSSNSLGIGGGLNSSGLGSGTIGSGPLGTTGLNALMNSQSSAMTPVVSSKSFNNKYLAHLRGFQEILTNLAQKLMNPGHSDAAAQEAMERLDSFGRQYEMFGKEIIEGYAQWTEQCVKLLEGLKEASKATTPIEQKLRKLATTQLALMKRIKILEQQLIAVGETPTSDRNQSQMELEGKHEIEGTQLPKTTIECPSTSISTQLLAPILAEKDRQLNQLRNRVNLQAKRLALLSDYSTLNAERIIKSNDGSVHECFCGAAQLEYRQKKWDEQLKKKAPKIVSQQIDKEKADIANQLTDQGDDLDSLRPSSIEVKQLVAQKQVLLGRNASLTATIQKLKSQLKQTVLTEEFIMNSAPYLQLREQCRHLLNYTNDLMTKLRKASTLLNEVQKARDEQIKGRSTAVESLQDGSFITKGQLPSNTALNQSQAQKALNVFRTQLTQTLQQVSRSFKELTSVSADQEAKLFKLNEKVATLYSEHSQATQKMNAQYNHQSQAKSDKNQFRHERFRGIESTIQALILKDEKANIKSEATQTTNSTPLPQLWIEFTEYVKGREQKLKNLETLLRKRQSALQQREKFAVNLQENIRETEGFLLKNNERLAKFDEFVTRLEKQIKSAIEQNFVIRADHEQQKALLQIKLKAESEARAKLDEKLKVRTKVEEQIVQVQKAVDEAQQRSTAILAECQQQLQTVRVQSAKKDSQIRLLTAKVNELNATIEKFGKDLQRQKLRVGTLDKQLRSVQNGGDYSLLKMELDEYKSKIICGCCSTRERQVVLKTCPHAFCAKCVDDIYTTRDRKCPNCRVKYTKADIHRIIWN